MKEDQKIVIYQTEDGQTQIDVRLENEMIWLTRQQLATLFGRDYKTISKHINNALREELADEVVVAKNANTIQHYNEVEMEKESSVKEYLTIGRIGEGSNLCKNRTSSNKNVHFYTLIA